MRELDLTGLIAAVDKSVGTSASAVTFIKQHDAQISAAVKAALEADDAADQGTIDLVQKEIDKVTAKTLESSDELGAALTSRPGPVDPVV